jgi:hypothetical protein
VPACRHADETSGAQTCAQREVVERYFAFHAGDFWRSRDFFNVASDRWTVIERPSFDPVHLSRSGQSSHNAPNLATPPPALRALIGATWPAGQRTVSLCVSMANASFEYLPLGAEGACTFTFASMPAASSVSTFSAVPYEESPYTSTPAAVFAAGSRPSTSASSLSVTSASPVLPGVTSVCTMTSESGSTAICPL